MKKKFGAFGAGQFSLGTLVGGQPGTTIFQNPGGGGGGGWGVSHTRTGPGRPPPGIQHSRSPFNGDVGRQFRHVQQPTPRRISTSRRQPVACSSPTWRLELLAWLPGCSPCPRQALSQLTPRPCSWSCSQPAHASQHQREAWQMNMGPKKIRTDTEGEEEDSIQLIHSRACALPPFGTYVHSELQFGWSETNDNLHLGT